MPEQQHQESSRQTSVAQGHQESNASVGFSAPILQLQASTPTPIQREFNQDQANEMLNNGRSLFQAEQYAEAINVFQRMLDMEDFPEDARDEILHNLGLANYRLERYATAANYFLQYQEVHPEDPQINRIITDSLNRIGASEERNENQGEGAGRRLFQLAQERFRAGNYRMAIILFERVRHLERLPEDIRTTMLFNAGLSNFHLGRYAAAQNYFEQYLESHPDQADSVQTLISQCQEQIAQTGTHEDSSASDAEARELFQQGQAAFDAGRWQEALTFFRRVMNVEAVDRATRFTMYYNMAQCFRHLNQRREAAQFYTFHLRTLQAGTEEYETVERLIREMEGESQNTEEEE